MPNGKKRKTTATLPRPRREVTGKPAKQSRLAMYKELPGDYAVRVNIPATPKIQLPVNGYVPPGVDLLVYVVTNRPDLRYKLELKDLNPPPGAVVFVHDIPAPGVKTFGGVFDGGLLVAERDFRIRVWVDPLDGPPPAHSDDVVYITTKIEFSIPISQDPN